MKRLILGTLLGLSVLLSGCAKGVITLDITRMGAADVSCKLVAVPMLSSALSSFSDEFKNDGYDVLEVKDGDMSGFDARKHYSKISDIKDSKVLETFKFDKLKQAAVDSKTGGSEKKTETKAEKGAVEEKKASEQKADIVKTPAQEKSMVTIKPGLLFDTVTVKTGLNLDPGVNKQSPEAKFLLNNVFNKMDLKFVVNLPTKADSSDATTVSEDGKSLTWNIAVGQSTPINATITYLNPIKAASWAAVVVLIIIGGILYHSYKIRKAQKVVADGSKK